MLPNSTADDITRTRLGPELRQNLARVFAPRRMAFIGGSHAEANLAILRMQPYDGVVDYVHPTRKDVGGIACVPSIADLPQAPDLAFVAVNADATITALDQLREMGAGGAVCYASGFAELGEAGMERNRAFIRAAGDMAVIGPNCYGLINHVTHASIWPAPYPQLAGGRGAAVISQSGNITGHFASNGRSVPFSYLISAGNQAVLGFEDYIDYLADDPNVTCLGLFMEGIRDVPGFARACLRAQAKNVPVIVCRSGRSDLGAAMAASHTSSLAGQNEYYHALFDRIGVIQTDNVPQFLEMLKLASLAGPMAGRRIAVFSSSGGDNGLAADYCSFAGLALPQPTATAVESIQPLLPAWGHVSNPLDFTAGYWGDEARLTPMFTELLSGDVDAGMLVIDFPPPGSPYQAGEDHAAMDRALAAAGKATGKPVFHASVNSAGITDEASTAMIAEGIVPLQGLHDAAEVIARWAGHGQARAAAQPPFAVPPLTGATRTVNEAESKRRLAAFGLALPQGQVVTRAQLDTLPEALDQPMVLKVLHDDLPHKTEVGGVALHLKTRAEVIPASERMAADALRLAGVPVDRFLLEAMQPPPLAELIVGVKRDPLFGMVLVIGAGGIFVELLKDARSLLLPVSRAEVGAAIRGLKVFPLLDGFRGRPPAQLDPIIDAIMAVADYAGENLATLAELDVNPLMVFAENVVAVDALIIEGQAGA